jgi:Myb-like DNA-binding protein RAP1
LIQLVVGHGGQISEDSTIGHYISKFGDAHRDVIDPKFIIESVEKKSLQDINTYKVLPYEDANNDAERADVEHLVSYLDDSAAQQASQDEPEQKTRQARLDAASSFPEGMFVTKEDRIKLLNKNGFTDQEDEIILEEVRKNPHRRSTHRLFHEIADKIGRHTGNSIRYRYRTHLSNQLKYVYKTAPDGSLIYDAEGKLIPSEEMPNTLKNKFTAKDDYFLSRAVKENLSGRSDNGELKDYTLPGKFFEQMAKEFTNHTRAAWRDRYRKFVTPYGIQKYITYYETEIAEGRTPEEIKNYTGRHLYKSVKKQKQPAENDLDTLVGENLMRHNEELSEEQRQAKRRKQNSSDLANDDASNLFLQGDQSEISGMFESQAAAAVAAASNMSPSLAENIEDHLTEDLVTAKFFEFQPLDTVIDKMKEIVGRDYNSGEADQLIDALYEEAGVQKKFGTYIITSVCGDVALIPKYFEMFLKTGQNPPQNVHGVWIQRDDDLLKCADQSNDEKALEFVTKLHGEKRVNLRRTFMAENIV